MPASEFEVLGETAELLAVSKPPGLLVHPTKPGGPRTLWDALKDLLGFELATGGQVSLINRLDRETSGIVLVAKSSAAARRAAMAMQEGKIQKSYLAIVHGWPAAEAFGIEAPILRLGEVGPTTIHLQRTVHPAGAPAHTKFRVLKRLLRNGERLSLLAAEPVTGRTHQIRVHAAHAGHPVVGDKIYGPSPDCYLEFIRTGWTPALAARLLHPRHALHSAGLTIEWDGSPLTWTSNLPPDLRAFLAGTETV